MRRTLVVQTAFLGDVVLTTPLLAALRTLPDTSIDVLTTPLGAQVLGGHPAVDHVIPYDKRGADGGLGALVARLNALRARGYDVAIAAQRSFRTGLMVRATRAPLRIGFRNAPGAWACNRTVPWRADQHAARRYLDLLAPTGIDPAHCDPRPCLPVLPEAAQRVDALLAQEAVSPSEPLLAFAPGSTWGTKRWLPEGYAAIARAAPARGLRPVFVGSPAERPLCLEIALAAGRGAVVLAGMGGIPELVATLARARALVTNDSGPGHVASAVGTPVVAVFGPTVPAFGYTPFGPEHRIVEHPDLPCRPCHSHGPEVCPLGHHRCMRDIGPAPVLAALDAVLAHGRAASASPTPACPGTLPAPR